MENYTIYVSKDPATAADLISRYIVGGSISGELLDDYVLQHGESGYCRVMVFEKYYYRVSNRLTLTVAIDNFEGRTSVHCVSGGGGQGVLFRFDWGSSSSFARSAYHALQNYII